jgi:hypothetical protein
MDLGTRLRGRYVCAEHYIEEMVSHDIRTVNEMQITECIVSYYNDVK